MSKIACPPLFSLEKAVLRSIRLKATAAGGLPQGPTTGKRWLVCDGAYTHTTGTDSCLMIRSKETEEVMSTSRILAADPDGTYPLFSIVSRVSSSFYSMWILDETMQLDLFGDTATYARIQVLEF